MQSQSRALFASNSAPPDTLTLSRMANSSPLANWQVFFLKPRAEKKVAQACVACAIPHYLPLRTVPRVCQRRRFLVTLPLFPGYIFASVTPDTRLAILRTNHVVRTLQPSQSVGLLRDLVQVRRALATTPDLKPVPILTQGQRVRFKNGPLQGAEGVVSHLAGSMRVVLAVELIGMGVSVTVARADVEPM